MNPKRFFPRDISQSPSEDEASDYLADLLEWLTRSHFETLREAGFDDQDLFTLRRLARDYRSGDLTPQTHADLYRLLDRLQEAGTWI
jgi:hypothetical protein